MDFTLAMGLLALAMPSASPLDSGAAGQEAPLGFDGVAAEAALKTALSTSAGGLSAAVFDADGVHWTTALGARDEAGQPVLTTTPFPVGSISKTAVAVVALRLVEQGVVSLDDPMEKWVAELVVDNDWAATDPIRLIHLLEHASGLPDYVKCESNLGDARRDLPLATALQVNPCERRVRWRPGTRSAYSNIGIAIAALMLERASRTPWYHLVEREVFTPLGMRSSSFRHSAADRAEAARGRRGGERIPTPVIAAFPAGSWVATATDVATLGRVLLAKGAGRDGARFLSEANVDRMERTESVPGFSGLARGNGPGLMRDAAKGRQVYYHGGTIGGFQARLAYSREVGRGYAIIVNDADVDLAALSEALEAHVFGPAPAAPAAPASTDDVAAWTGTYVLSSPRASLLAPLEIATSIRTLEVVDGRLVMRSGDKTTPLVSRGNGLLRREDDAAATMRIAAADGALAMYDGATWTRRPAAVVRAVQLGVGASALMQLLGALVLPIAAIVLLVRSRGEPGRRRSLPALVAGGLTSLTLIGFLLMLTGNGFGPGDDSRPSGPARVFQLITILYPLLAVVTAAVWWRTGRARWLLPFVLSAVVMVAFAAAFGWIDVRIWCTSL